MKVCHLLEKYVEGRANNEARVSHGMNAQELIIHKLQEQFGDRFKFISTAGRSSQVADIIGEIDGVRYQFEVKSRADKNGVMTLYTKTMWPNQRDALMDAFSNSFSNGKARNFTELMELQKQEKPGSGWPGDEGSPKSGAVNIRADDRKIISRVRRQLMRYLTASDDDYFVVVTRNTGDVNFYKLGTSKPNVLEAPNLPILKRVIMKTDGGADKGGMRVAVKVQLAV